jgi:hypothetical protein
MQTPWNAAMRRIMIAHQKKQAQCEQVAGCIVTFR